MSKRLFGYTVAAIAAMGGWMSESARADWPARVFAPYAEISSSRGQLTNCYQATGQKYFTLAFMNSRDSYPYWEDFGSPADHVFADQIAAIRAVGGDVIMSFGGAAANTPNRQTGKYTELAAAESDPAALAAKYQQIVDAYKLTRIDQDIEEANVHVAATNERRNTALAALQKANPGLIIDYTLPVGPNGVGPDEIHLLTDAKAKGLKVAVVNVMTMDYGGSADTMGKTMGELAVMAAQATYQQCQAIDPDIKVGICPDIGQNDNRSEVFTIPDTKKVLEFAQATPWVTLITFWEVGRDNGGRGRGGGGGGFAGGGAATRAGGPATRRGGRAGGGGGFAAGGAATRAGGPATRRGGRRGAATTIPSNLAVSGNGIPPAQPLEYINTFKVFTVGFTPAK